MKISTVVLSGLAALVMGCATEGANPVPTPSYCSKDMDCKGDRVCDKGVCVDGGSGSGKYTCETACNHIVYECKCTSATSKNFDYCLNNDCGGEGSKSGPWSQAKIDYASTSSCGDMNCSK